MNQMSRPGRSEPFRLHVQLEQAFAHRGWLQARAAVLDALAAGRAVALLGLPGVGKSLLLREVARSLAAEGRTVRLVERGDALDAAPPEGVLLVDEAGALPDDVLRGLIESGAPCVLAGLPGFVARLEGAPGHLTAVALEPIAPDEVAGYVSARLAEAGRPADLFEPAALAALAHHARGLLRLVNALGRASLFLAEMEGAPEVAARHVEEADMMRRGIEADTTPLDTAPAGPIGMAALPQDAVAPPPPEAAVAPEPPEAAVAPPPTKMAVAPEPVVPPPPEVAVAPPEPAAVQHPAEVPPPIPPERPMAAAEPVAPGAASPAATPARMEAEPVEADARFLAETEPRRVPMTLATAIPATRRRPARRWGLGFAAVFALLFGAAVGWTAMAWMQPATTPRTTDTRPATGAPARIAEAPPPPDAAVLSNPGAAAPSGPGVAAPSGLAASGGFQPPARPGIPPSGQAAPVAPAPAASVREAAPDAGTGGPGLRPEPSPAPAAALPLAPTGSSQPAPSARTARPVPPPGFRESAALESFALFRGPVFNDTIGIGGRLTLAIRRVGPNGAVSIRFDASNGLVGTGELTGRLSADGYLTASGTLMMGRNPFECDLAGTLSAERLTGSASFTRLGAESGGPTSQSRFALTRS